MTHCKLYISQLLVLSHLIPPAQGLRKAGELCFSSEHTRLVGERDNIVDFFLLESGPAERIPVLPTDPLVHEPDLPLSFYQYRSPSY